VDITARKITASTEKYLSGIYRLQSKEGVAKTSKLVNLFGVAPGTVTNTIKRLEREGLVIHQPYKGITLTEEGCKIALRIVRKHEVLEQLLTHILEVDVSLAREVAANIGYYIPDDVVRKIEEVLSKGVKHKNGE